MTHARATTLLLSIFVPILTIALTATGCRSNAPSSQADPVVRTVQTTKAQEFGQQSGRSFSGTLRSPLETNLSFRVAGKVTEVHVNSGDRVASGGVIATLDREDFRLQVEAARASYRQARAAAQNARSELRRAKALYADDNISISDYERAHTTYETKQNQSEAALRRLDLAKKRLAYTRLTAPTPGSIAGTRVEAGENVRAGQPVARLTSGDRLEVTVEVPEGMVERIQTGQQAAVTATTMGDSTVMGAVTEIAAAPSGSRPTYPVVVTLRKPVPSLRSGMSAQVRFTSDHRSGLVVPSSAVSEDHRGRFVYIVDCPGATADTTLASGADGRIRRQAVSTGDIIDRGLVIRDSLGAGDEVVIAGHSMIAPGDPVRISQLLTDR